ncbi:MAG: hypothetical protein AAB853_04140, partial [Patescibacteria group bacterium]
MGDILEYLQTVHMRVNQVLDELRRAGYGEEAIEEAGASARVLNENIQRYADLKRKIARQLRSDNIPATSAQTFVQYLSTG